MVYTSVSGKTYHACNCMCHTPGASVMHFMACCDLCYEKYLREDGSIDEAKVASIAESYEARDQNQQNQQTQA